MFSVCVPTKYSTYIFRVELRAADGFYRVGWRIRPGRLASHLNSEVVGDTFFQNDG
jgi:hypothetical protein